MTKLLEDILREPVELSKSLAYAFERGSPSLGVAAALLGKSDHVYVVGMGSS